MLYLARRIFRHLGGGEGFGILAAYLPAASALSPKSHSSNLHLLSLSLPIISPSKLHLSAGTHHSLTSFSGSLSQLSHHSGFISPREFIIHWLLSRLFFIIFFHRRFSSSGAFSVVIFSVVTFSPWFSLRRCWMLDIALALLPTRAFLAVWWASEPKTCYQM